MVRTSKGTVIKYIEKFDVIKRQFYFTYIYLSVMYSVIKKSKDFISYK